jgi:hypothetical protein
MTTIQFGVNTDHGILESTLKEMGFGVYRDEKNGLIEFYGKGINATLNKNGFLRVQQGSENIVAEIKKAYGAKTVEAAATKAGWTVKKVPGKANQWTASKRFAMGAQGKVDEITIELMPSGIIKTTTSKVSMANHKTAEEFLEHMQKLAGGKTEFSRRGAAFERNPDLHHHDHLHEGGGHSHG